MTKKQLKVKTSISLDQEVIDLLDDFSKVFGVTRSAAINDLILMARPQLTKLVSEYNKFVSEVDKTMPITQDQMDMFAGRVFRNIFGE